jgi:ABC-type dipeptide/oligopeptide/nickel transport system permease subunit
LFGRLTINFLVILLMVFFGRHIVLIFIAIGAVEWLTMARIVRGQTLSIRRREFIEAAEASGVSNWAIIRRHILPNVIGPVIVYVTLTVPAVILAESFLSFLGLGVQEPATSWGVLISDGKDQMESYPWMLIFPALFRLHYSHGDVPRPYRVPFGTFGIWLCGGITLAWIVLVGWTESASAHPPVGHRERG